MAVVCASMPDKFDVSTCPVSVSKHQIICWNYYVWSTNFIQQLCQNSPIWDELHHKLRNYQKFSKKTDQILDLN